MVGKPICGRNLASLSSASALVSSVIQSRSVIEARYASIRFATSSSIRCLATGGEVPLDVDLADGLAERALDQGDAALPALLQLPACPAACVP